MSFFNEFKAFAMRGNVIDLAVGVVIGAAFGPIGLLIGGVDFSAYRWILQAAGPDGKGEVAIQFGAFLNTIIQFAIVALAIFLVVKLMNRLMRKQEEVPAAPAPEVVLLTEIRDLLKNSPPR